jgi:hypothetical protein
LNIPNRAALLTLLLAISLLANRQARADPLHVDIDRLVAARLDGSAAKLATDDEFLRRVYLDLTGSIPAADRARAFLDDSSPDKRSALIDRLLASPEFPRRMQEAFDLMLMERRPGGPAWEAYLRESFAAGKPLDQLAREILGPDADDPKTRAAAAFTPSAWRTSGRCLSITRGWPATSDASSSVKTSPVPSVTTTGP